LKSFRKLKLILTSSWERSNTRTTTRKWLPKASKAL
jgi:hypothetical protein